MTRQLYWRRSDRRDYFLLQVHGRFNDLDECLLVWGIWVFSLASFSLRFHGIIGMLCGHGAFFCVLWVIECREGGCPVCRAVYRVDLGSRGQLYTLSYFKDTLVI
jgi:hypothetical protein